MGYFLLEKNGIVSKLLIENTNVDDGNDGLLWFH